ncbi:MAG TPA: hypothetical protein VFD73_12570 [Gemmatimonadales bacterium]|nr:hypothetical protein [Gemmatimonadales bacterium]
MPQTVDYEDLLRGTALAVGLNPDDLAGGADGDFANLRLLHGQRLDQVWIHREWPFVCPTERRAFRDPYVALTAYAAGAEVIYVGPGKYYQTLRSATGQAPATWDGTTWTTNLAYWAESALTYSAQEYSASAAYVRGQQVYYSPTGAYYQLHAATSTGNLPTDTSYWGVLTAFDPYIDYEQAGQTAFDHAFRAWSHNPHTDRRAVQLDAWLTHRGLQVPGALRPAVWVDLRERCPQLTGEVYSATTAYAEGDQVYFREMPSYRGNFYTCATATTAGESPANTAAKWTLVEIPNDFARYLIHAAAAGYLTTGTEAERADYAREAREAQSALDQLTLLHAGQCAARPKTRYRTR